MEAKEVAGARDADEGTVLSHFPRNPFWRNDAGPVVAMCGKVLIGVPATPDAPLCAVCDSLARLGLERPHEEL